MSKKDFVAAILQIVEEAEDLRQADLLIRQQYGGARPYIRHRDAEGKVESVGSSLATGATMREAFAHAGVSQATGYRYLHRRWRR